MFTLKHLYLMNLANLPEGEVSWLEILQNCQRGKKIREMGYAVHDTGHQMNSIDSQTENFTSRST